VVCVCCLVVLIYRSLGREDGLYMYSDEEHIDICTEFLCGIFLEDSEGSGRV
jgi:hypothetical protein